MALVIVEYWPKGYASEEGLKRVEMEEGVNLDYLEAIRKIPESRFAVIYSVRPKVRPAVAPVSLAYAREMSFKDNS